MKTQGFIQALQSHRKLLNLKLEIVRPGKLWKKASYLENAGKVGK